MHCSHSGRWPHNLSSRRTQVLQLKRLNKIIDASLYKELQWQFSNISVNGSRPVLVQMSKKCSIQNSKIAKVSCFSWGTIEKQQLLNFYHDHRRVHRKDGVKWLAFSLTSVPVSWSCFHSHHLGPCLRARYK